jgi:adenylosuccinate synthase
VDGEIIAGSYQRADLPAGARRYVDRVRDLVGLPVSVVSVGPDREQTIRV